MLGPQFGVFVVTRRKGDVRGSQVMGVVGNAEVEVVSPKRRIVVRSVVFMVYMKVRSRKIRYIRN